MADCNVEYANMTTIKDVAQWIIREKVGFFGTSKSLLYQAAVEGVSGSLSHQKRKFTTPVEWAEFVSNTSDKVVDYIIKNDKCIVPIYDR